MLQFTTTTQHYPATRAAALRAQDFSEISQKFDPAAAAEQASRCSQCGVPFCQIHCPLANNIPDWLKLAAEGRLPAAQLARRFLRARATTIQEILDTLMALGRL